MNSPPPSPPPAARWELDRLHPRPALIWTLARGSLRLRQTRSVLTVLTLATTTAFVVHVLLQPPGATAADRNAWRLLLALAVLVSTAGVLNTLLTSVQQRTREIGTMKCLGAPDAYILLAILTEAAVLGVAGALLGAVAGAGLALVLALLQPGEAIVPYLALAQAPRAFLIATGLCLALALTGALIPAALAARLTPLQALRESRND